MNFSVDLARLAEKLGFSTVWVPDSGPAPPYSDCVVTLAAIASQTDKIRFGSAIVNFYTRNPAWVASSFLALSDLGRKNSGGGRSYRGQRAIIGIGVGSDYNVSKFGVGTRKGVIDELREAVESIRELFQGKEVSARTDSFAIERVSLSKSKTSIPVHIGSGSPKGLTLSGEIADGAILTNRIPEELKDSLAYIDHGLNSASRKRNEVEVTNSVVISVDDDRRKAKKATKVTCAYLVGWMDDDLARKHGLDVNTKNRIAGLIGKGEEASAARLVDDTMLDLLTVSGTVEECVEKCREHMNYGIDQIAFCEPFGPNVKSSIELIAKRIIPRI